MICDSSFSLFLSILSRFFITLMKILDFIDSVKEEEEEELEEDENFGVFLYIFKENFLFFQNCRFEICVPYFRLLFIFVLFFVCYNVLSTIFHSFSFIFLPLFSIILLLCDFVEHQKKL